MNIKMEIKSDYSINRFPQYVLLYLCGGNYREFKNVVLSRSQSVWLLKGCTHAVHCRADTAAEAERKLVEKIACLTPKTDRRRRYWEYT